MGWWIGLAAATGALVRYLATVWGKARFPQWPVATWAINCSGAFLAGLCCALPALSPWRLALVTGFAGGFTTFSTLMTEAFIMFHARRWAAGLAYYLGTPVTGLLAVVAGQWLGGQLF